MLLNSAPLITYYSADPAQESSTEPTRVELSQATVDNWIAKTSNLLCDEFGFGPELPEASAVVELPLHWLHSVWLASLWNVGAHITTREPQASLIVTEAGQSEQVESALARANRNQAVVACALGAGLDPLGPASPSTQHMLPPTVVDYSHDVRMFADSFDSGYLPTPDDLAITSETDSYTHAQLAQLAQDVLAAYDVKPGGRVLLSNLPLGHDRQTPGKSHEALLPQLHQDPQLATAVALGALIWRGFNPQQPSVASLVLCNALSPEQIAQVASQERATLIF